MNKKEEQTEIFFRDNRWLEKFPLNKENVLDYFSLSSFYDKTCNNEQIKMQRLELNKLIFMIGIEYTVIFSQEPDLFIIRKQKRENKLSTIPIAIYYIIHGFIFQAPTIYSVISSRIV